MGIRRIGLLAMALLLAGFFWMTATDRALAQDDWGPVFEKSFDNEDLTVDWFRNQTDPGVKWEISTTEYDDVAFESTASVGVALPDGHSEGLSATLARGPIHLTEKAAADVSFSYKMDIELDAARLGFCVGTNETFAETDCTWFDVNTEDWWEYAFIDLSAHVGQSIYVGWVFETIAATAMPGGVYVDEVQLWAATGAMEPEYEWLELEYESFYDNDFSFYTLWDPIPDPNGATWSISDAANDDITPDTFSVAAAPQIGGYPAGYESWLIYGPIDLSDYSVAEIYYSVMMNAGPGDFLGVGVGAGPNIADFDPNGFQWFADMPPGEWLWEYMDLTPYAGQPDVYIAWAFASEAGSAGLTGAVGAFIDEVEISASVDAPAPFDYADLFGEWTDAAFEPFDMADLSAAPEWTLVNETGAPWTISTTIYDDFNPDSTQAAGISPDGTGYPAGTESWMIYGPIDLSGAAAADVMFSLQYDMVLSDDGNEANDDYLGFYVGAGTPGAPPTPDMFNPENAIFWTGSSSGVWDTGYLDLTPYALMSDIYLAWSFESPAGATEKTGAFIDEISVWTLGVDAVVDALDYDSEGLWNNNGDFDRNILGWDYSGLDGGVTIEGVDNAYAVVSGNQLFYQPFNVSKEISDLFVSMSYAIETTETVRGNDIFCLSLTPVGDAETIVVDFGCWDVIDFPDFAMEGVVWDVFEQSLSEAELENKIRKSDLNQMAFTIVLKQNGQTNPTRLYIDDIQIYATGLESNKESDQNDGVAKQRDPNEPNDLFEQATPIACGQEIKGVFGDVWGGFDLDVFKMAKAPNKRITVDVNADTLRPSSAADSYLVLYDGQYNYLDENDDDGVTLDSKLVYTNETAGEALYFEVSSLFGGGPEFFYTIKVTCEDIPVQRSDAATGGPVAARATPKPGDLDGDNDADIADAILALKVMAGLSPAVNIGGDVNNDSRIGHHEAIFALQTAAGIRGSSDTWTAMLYLNAEDQSCVKSGDENACWNKIYEESIRRIEEYIGDKKDFLTVVALVDGPNFSGVPKDVTRYVVQPNGAYTDGVNKFELDEINMGDPSTLVNFVKWCKANHPADRYYLSIDDHGNGIFGTSWDHHGARSATIDDQTTMPELRSALKEITDSGTKKIDVFDFESCLMGFAENAYDIRNYVRYIAFFQPISWTSYNYPEYFRPLQAGDSPLTMGKRIIDQYPVSNENNPYTFALVDAAKMDAVREAVDAFAEQLMNADLSTVKAARNASQAFNGKTEKGDPTEDFTGYIDLWYLADRVAAAGIAQTEAGAVKSAVDAAVVHKRAIETGRDPVWDYSNYHGLSILYPQAAYTFLADYWRDFLMSKDGKWDEFLTDKVFKGYDFGRGSSATRSNPGPIYNLPDILEPRPIVLDNP